MSISVTRIKRVLMLVICLNLTGCCTLYESIKYTKPKEIRSQKMLTIEYLKAVDILEHYGLTEDKNE